MQWFSRHIVRARPQLGEDRGRVGPRPAWGSTRQLPDGRPVLSKEGGGVVLRGEGAMATGADGQERSGSARERGFRPAQTAAGSLSRPARIE